MNCMLYVTLLHYQFFVHVSVNSAHNTEVINSIISSIGTECYEEDLIRSKCMLSIMFYCCI